MVSFFAVLFPTGCLVGDLGLKLSQFLMVFLHTLAKKQAKELL